MPKINSYNTTLPYVNDYIVGTDVDTNNVTRNYPVSSIINVILSSINIGTVTSVGTASSAFVSVTGGDINTTGNITMDLSAQGLGATLIDRQNQFLRGDNTWSLPGPPPNVVKIEFNSNVVTLDVDSLDFKGTGVVAGGSNNSITVNILGSDEAVDSLIAGAGISLDPPNGIGAVKIINSGTTLARAGGNVTLSGGTDVKLNTTANAGTLSVLSPGIGIDVIQNNTSNPEIDIDYNNANNIVKSAEAITLVDPNDLVAFNQNQFNNVKTARFRNINENILTSVKNHIDNGDGSTTFGDKNKIKNIEPAGYTNVGAAKNIVTLTLTEYQQIGTPDPNTLYLIIGSAPLPTFTQNLSRNTSGIVQAGTSTPAANYSLSPSLPQSVTGISGTNFTFNTTISSNEAITNQSGFSSSGQIGNANATTNQILIAEVAQPAVPQCSALLQVNASGDLTSGLGTIWEYSTDANKVSDVTGNVSPTNNCPASYNFTVILKIINTNDYEWTSGVNGTISGVYLTFLAISGSADTPSKTINYPISAQYTQKTYTASLSGASPYVDDSGISNQPAGGIAWSVQSLLPNTSFTNIISNLNESSNFQWNNPEQSTVNQYSANPSPDSYSWSNGSPTFTGTALSSQTINGSNGTGSITASGTIIYTPPLVQNSISINYTDIITYTSGTSSSNWVVTPAQGTSSGSNQTEGTGYTIGNGNSPSGSVNSGYIFTSGPSFTNTNSLGVTGLMPSTPVPAIAEYKIEGTLSKNLATVVLNVTNAPYGAAYQLTIGNSLISSVIIQQTGPGQTQASSLQNTGSFTFSVSRVPNPTSGATSVTFPDGSSSSYGPNQNIYNATGAVSGVSTGTTVTVTINES